MTACAADLNGMTYGGEKAKIISAAAGVFGVERPFVYIRRYGDTEGINVVISMDSSRFLILDITRDRIEETITNGNAENSVITTVDTSNPAMIASLFASEGARVTREEKLWKETTNDCAVSREQTSVKYPHTVARDLEDRATSVAYVLGSLCQKLAQKNLPPIATIRLANSGPQY